MSPARRAPKEARLFVTKLRQGGLQLENLKAVLSKVDVEGKSLWNLQSFHDAEAGAVRQGKLLVIVLADDCSCPLFVRCANTDDRSATVIQLIEKSKCRVAANPREREGVSFSKDQVRGDQLSWL